MTPEIPSTHNFVHGDQWLTDKRPYRLVSRVDWNDRPSVLKEAVIADPKFTHEENDLKVNEAIMSLVGSTDKALNEHHLVLAHTTGTGPSTIFDGATSIFLVSDYIPGRLLSEIPAQELQEMSSDDLVRLYLDIFIATCTVRQSGYMMRDLEPYNVIVSPENRAYVTDFGDADELNDYRDRIISGRAEWPNLDEEAREDLVYPETYALDVDGLFRIARKIGAIVNRIDEKYYAQKEYELIEESLSKYGKNLEFGNPEEFKEILLRVVQGQGQIREGQ